jgi:chromosomal replication initiator protein
MTVTIDAIKRAAADHYGVSVMDIEAHIHTAKPVRARHVAMTLARQLTAKSLPVIARYFGGRHHSNVLYAIRKIERQAAGDDGLARDLAAIAVTLGAGHE